MHAAIADASKTKLLEIYISCVPDMQFDEAIGSCKKCDKGRFFLFYPSQLPGPLSLVGVSSSHDRATQDKHYYKR